MALNAPPPDAVQLAEAGLVAPHLPKPWGLGADANHQLLIDDELKRANLSTHQPIGIGGGRRSSSPAPRNNSGAGCPNC